MKLKITVLLSLFVGFAMHAQVYYAKEYSKDQALYKAKEFVMHNILGKAESKFVKFEIDALAAAASGELTSLVYTCEQKNINGLVLGFFGSRWNPAGVVYQSYAFKNLPNEKAIELLSLIDNTIKEQASYFGNYDTEGKNVYFHYDDMTFLLYYSVGSPKIRVFWDDFDSEWESTAFNRTKKRFEKSLKKSK